MLIFETVRALVHSRLPKTPLNKAFGDRLRRHLAALASEVSTKRSTT